MSKFTERLAAATQPQRDEKARREREAQAAHERHAQEQLQQAAEKQNLVRLYDQQVQQSDELLRRYTIVPRLEDVVSYIRQTNYYRGKRLNFPRYEKRKDGLIEKVFGTGKMQTVYLFPLKRGDIVSEATLLTYPSQQLLAYETGQEKFSKRAIFEDLSPPFSSRQPRDVQDYKASRAHNVRHVFGIAWSVYNYDYEVRRSYDLDPGYTTEPGFGNEGLRLDVLPSGIIVAEFTKSGGSLATDNNYAYTYKHFSTGELSDDLLESAISAAYAGTMRQTFADAIFVAGANVKPL